MPLPTPPTNPIPTFATDANYNAPGDDWDATPTKVAPTVALETQGYVPGDPRPADVDNYLFATTFDWLTYLDDYTAEVTEGPASSTDNAIVRFDGTTGKKVQNSVVTISDTGDVAGVDDLDVNGTITLTGEVNYDTPKTVTVYRRVWQPFVDETVAQPWVKGTGVTWQTTNVASDQNGMLVPLHGLLNGHTIKKARVWVTPGAARGVGDRVSVQLYRTDTSGASSLAAAVEDDGTTNAQRVGPTGLSAVVDPSTYDYYLHVISGNSAATDVVAGVEVEIEISGLRGA